MKQLKWKLIREPMDGELTQVQLRFIIALKETADILVYNPKDNDHLYGTRIRKVCNKMGWKNKGSFHYQFDKLTEFGIVDRTTERIHKYD